MCGVIVIAFFVIILPISTCDEGIFGANITLTHEDRIKLAQCSAWCYKQHAVIQDEKTNIENDMLQSAKCENIPCEQCLLGCITRHPNATCYSQCHNAACLASCHFRRSLGVTSLSSYYSNYSLRPPRFLCYHYSHDNAVTGVVVTWNLAQVVSDEQEEKADLEDNIIVRRRRRRQSKMPRTKLVSGSPFVFFVVEQRAEGEDGWRPLGNVAGGWVSITFPASNVQYRYQFQVTAVTFDGIIAKPLQTRYTLNPSGNYSIPAPKAITVIHTRGQNRKVTATLAVEHSDNPSCEFKIDLLPMHESAYYVTYRAKDPEQFYQIDLPNLHFETNYSIIVRGVETDGNRESKDRAITSVITPMCLQMFNYNFTICAPGPPKYLRIRRSTFSDPLVISWEPPLHAANNNRVIEYKVQVTQKLDPLQTAHATPHRVSRSVTGDKHNLELGAELPVGFEYQVDVMAKSMAGVGKPVSTEYFLGGFVWTNVGIAITCSIASSVIIAALIYMYCRRRSSMNNEVDSSKSTSVTPSSIKSHDIPADIELVLRRAQKVHRAASQKDQYEIDFASVIIGAEIGSGAFGVVYKCEARINGIRLTLALKTLKERAPSEEREMLLQEIEFLKQVGKHPHIVAIQACCTTGDKIALLVEYCSLGDLKTYLTKLKDNIDNDACGFEMQLSEELIEQMISWGRQITLAMEHLSARRLVHRDLATRNVLMVSKSVIKITDFGLSRDTYTEGLYRKSTKGKLPIRWMALESLTHSTYTIQSDVWSFGVLLWEIFTLGQTPYSTVENAQLIQHLQDGNRLPKPIICNTLLYKLLCSCWKVNPKMRPTFTALKLQLEAILENSKDYFSFEVETCV